MKNTNVLVVSKNTGIESAKFKPILGEGFDIDVKGSISDLADVETEKPLLMPTTIVIVFVEGYEAGEIVADLKRFRDGPYVNLSYGFLLVSKSPGISTAFQSLSDVDDFIVGEFTPEILAKRVNSIKLRCDNTKKLTRDLNEASDIALLSMSHSSELGEISRFILSSYYCIEYSDLFELLFDTIKVFSVSCSALIVVDDQVLTRLAEGVSSDVKKKMLAHHNRGRIHHFGRDTIITFAHASIMLHKMPLENATHFGRLLDNLTVLGNCFEARTKGIHAEKDADAASRAKTMFLATMSHELRTPMNSVIGFTERLIEKLDGRLSEREEKQLFAIKRNGDHLLSVINDILDMSKIEVGKMEVHPEKIDAVELVNSIFQQLQPIAQNKNLEFGIRTNIDSSIVHADSKRFTQIVMNLVSNAIKYTEKGSVTIDMKVSRFQEDGEFLAISIIDTGIGISEDDQKRLFGNFVQIDSELSRKVEGTGLGLAISMILAEMHGGHIEVTSVENSGSSFSFLVPLCTNPKALEVVDGRSSMHEYEKHEALEGDYADRVVSLAKLQHAQDFGDNVELF